MKLELATILSNRMTKKLRCLNTTEFSLSGWHPEKFSLIAKTSLKPVKHSQKNKGTPLPTIETARSTTNLKYASFLVVLITIKQILV